MNMIILREQFTKYFNICLSLKLYVDKKFKFIFSPLFNIFPFLILHITFYTQRVTISITIVFILYKSYKNVNNMAILKYLIKIQQPVYQHTEVI